MTGSFLDGLAQLDEGEIDDLAARMLKAFSAVIDFGRPNEGDGALFRAAVMKALVYAQAGLITHEKCRDGDEPTMAVVASMLALTVADFRSDA